MEDLQVDPGPGAPRGLRIPAARYVADRENPSYHPGRCARLTAGGVTFATLGEVHPAVREAFDPKARKK